MVSANGGSNFTENKSATSSSHYSCQLDVTASDLAGKWIAGFTHYSGSRSTATGDSYISCSFTHNGTTYNPTSTYPSNTTGTLSNGVIYTVHADTRGQAVFFSKPVQLSSIVCRCGSGVGQWVESDSLYLTMSGFK